MKRYAIMVTEVTTAWITVEAESKAQAEKLFGAWSETDRGTDYILEKLMIGNQTVTFEKPIRVSDDPEVECCEMVSDIKYYNSK